MLSLVGVTENFEQKLNIKFHENYWICRSFIALYAYQTKHEEIVGFKLFLVWCEEEKLNEYEENQMTFENEYLTNFLSNFIWKVVYM